ncbi:hypothetical protein HDU82_009080 [Entophlyctis luteolus]|nr:hypothetical protein HDU82_009080 [Entophlyctis luteolus]
MSDVTTNVLVPEESTQESIIPTTSTVQLCTVACATTAGPPTSPSTWTIAVPATNTQPPPSQISISKTGALRGAVYGAPSVPSTSMNSSAQSETLLGSLTAAVTARGIASGVTLGTPSSTATLAVQSADLAATVPANVLFGGIGAAVAVLILAASVGAIAFRRKRRRQRRRDALARATAPPQWGESGTTTATTSAMQRTISGRSGDVKNKGLSGTGVSMPRQQRPTTFDALQVVPFSGRPQTTTDAVALLPSDISEYPTLPAPPPSQQILFNDLRQTQNFQRRQASELQRQLWANAYPGNYGWYTEVPPVAASANHLQLSYQPFAISDEPLLQYQQQQQQTQYQQQTAYSKSGSGSALVDRYAALSSLPEQTTNSNVGNEYAQYNRPNPSTIGQDSYSHTVEPQTGGLGPIKLQTDGTMPEYKQPAGRASLRRKQKEEMEEILSQAVAGGGGVGWSIDGDSMENQAMRGSSTPPRPHLPRGQSLPRNKDRDGAAPLASIARIDRPTRQFGREFPRENGILPTEGADSARPNVRTVDRSSPSQMLKYVGHVDENGDYHYP